MNIKLVLIIIVSLVTGILGGYSLALVAINKDKPSHTDVQLRSFATSYGALRNIKEKGNSEAVSLMYTMMNSSLKEMYNLYPTASDHDREMIYISFKGYSDHILTNQIYKQKDPHIDKLVTLLLKEHNKSSNLTGAKDAPSS